MGDTGFAQRPSAPARLLRRCSSWRRCLVLGAVALGCLGSAAAQVGCEVGSCGTAGKKAKQKKKKKKSQKKEGTQAKPSGPSQVASSERAGNVIFLHHSTGENIYNGGVPAWLASYNQQQGKSYRITERAFPDEPYPWNNYPYDYWNIWVKNAGPEPFLGQETLEILTQRFGVIVLKHCFPVSAIEEGGAGDVASEQKTLPGYQAQYQALKSKLRSFPATRFLVWTGAALTRTALTNDFGGNDATAQRAQQFFHWVKSTWDEPGDNIFIFDFYQLETGGGLFMKDEHAVAPGDPHPNEAFAQSVAPLLGQRIVDVIEGRGDSGSLTGR